MIYKNRYIQGQVTVFAALSLMLVLTLIITCVRSDRAVLYTTMSKQATLLSVEAIFAAYQEDMLDEYDVFVLEQSDELDDKFKWYVTKNVTYTSNSVNVTSASITNRTRATDSGGELLRAQIVEQMKYGVYTDILAELDVIQEAARKASVLQESVDKIVDCTDELSKMDSDILRLVELVEGVDTNDSGFVLSNGMPVATGEAYAKELVHGEVSESSVNINKSAVYSAMSYDYNLYLDIDELLDDMLNACTNLAYIGDEASEELGQASYANIYSRDYESIYSAVSDTLDKTNEALDVIEQFYSDRSSAVNTISNASSFLGNNVSDIGEETYAGMKQDLDDMKSSAKSDDQKLATVVTLKTALSKNKTALVAAKETLETMNVALTAECCDTVYSSTSKCIEILGNYSVENLKFDYSSVDFTATNSGLDAIKKLYDELKDGYTGIVLEGKSVSDKSVSYENLAINYKSTYSSNESSAKELINTGLYDEYLMTHFNVYTDYIDETDTDTDTVDSTASSDSKTSELLDYTIEYIIGGSLKDSENLDSVIVELSLIREGLNLAYLISDSEKRNEAYTLAASILGFTGSDALIRVGQYLVLAFWALGESVVDLRQLYDGKKVELTKSADTWNLSLSNLLAMQFESAISDTVDGDAEGEKTESGLAYKDYLRALLYIMDTADKNYRTMTLMELRMIQLGHESFRMCNYIMEAKAEATYTVSGISSSIKQSINYSYINVS